MEKSYLKISFKTPFNNTRQPFATTGESLTKTEMAPDCDINTIMKKYEKTGILEHRNTYEGQYGDFTETPGDYHEAMNRVIDAREMFETVPAKIRRRFGNDAGAFLDFVSDPQNSDEMVSLGLAKPHQPPSKASSESTPTKEATQPQKAGKPAATESSEKS